MNMEAILETRTRPSRFCQLMQRLEEDKDASDGGIKKHEWFNLLQDLGLDPRTTVMTEWCERCFGNIKTVKIDDTVRAHEIRLISRRLLFFLLNWTSCPCMGRKKQIPVTLLEIIAARGHMEALKASIMQMQKIDKDLRLASTGIVRSLTIGRSSNTQNKEDPDKLSDASKRHVKLRRTAQTQRYLGERIENTNPESSVGTVGYHGSLAGMSSGKMISDNVEQLIFNDPENDSDTSDESSFDTGPYSDPTFEENPTLCLQKHNHNEDNSSASSKLLLLPTERTNVSETFTLTNTGTADRVRCKSFNMTDHDLGTIKFTSPHTNCRSSTSKNSLEDGALPKAEGDVTCHNNIDAATGHETACKIFSQREDAEVTEENLHTELATAEIHAMKSHNANDEPDIQLDAPEIFALKNHVDQSLLLSLCLQAVYHNFPLLVSCALALTPDNLAQLVRFSSSHLSSKESVLQLYRLSLGSIEHFQRVPEGDLQALEQRTLREEHVQLCRIAWQDMDEEAEKAVRTARQHNFKVDFCSECTTKLFPETGRRGKPVIIKFHRHFDDNSVVFNRILAGKCSCDLVNSRRPIRTITLLPACAAAVTGNIRMLELLTRGWSAFSRDCTLHKPNALCVPRRGCLKNSPSVRTKHVRFKEEVENFGESSLEDILIHTLYGGNDKCFHYVLQNMTATSLTAREIINCLVMALRVGRSDLFLEIACKFGVNVNSLDGNESTPLMVATSFQRPLLVCVLLSLGASPTAANEDGETAVDCAIRSTNGDHFLALRLLSAVADDELEEMHMPLAIWCRNFRVVHHLFSRGIVSCRDIPSYGLGFYTRHHYYTRSVDRVQYIPMSIWFIKHMCRDYSDEDMATLELFLSNDRDAAFTLALGWTPLHLLLQYATNQSIRKAFNLVLRHTTSVNAQTLTGTPLYLAITKGITDSLGPLMQAGASLYSPNPTTLQATMNYRRYNVMVFLLHAGYRCSPQESEGLKSILKDVGKELRRQISSIRSQPLSLTMLCAASLREAFQDSLQNYLQIVNCPQMVRRFVNLEHLVDQFLTSSPLTG